MTKALGIGKRVKLKLLDPDGEHAFKPPAGGWPLVEGELIAAVPALHGKLWYLMKLDKPLSPGFNPLHSDLPEMFQTIPIWYLLLSPEPNIPTIDVPPDYVGDRLNNGQTAMVGVSVAGASKRLPKAILMDDVPSRFPGLCSGDLEAVEK